MSATMNEPPLADLQIQGDVLAGFRKDHVGLMFLRFDAARIAEAKAWIRSLVPHLANLRDVAHFNAAFRSGKLRIGYDPPLTALWINIAFTASGLLKLRGEEDAAKFETAFRIGARARAAGLGDPSDGPGSPCDWLVGGPENEPDAMLNIAGDLKDQVAATCARMRDSIAATRGAIEVVHEDVGNARIAPETGHEHFGFKDGISQPGVRGTVGSTPAPLTRRLIDPSDPLYCLYAAPGQPLLAPGEFVVGYDRQHPENPTGTQSEADYRTEPAWATNGSYLVYRRLRQDVAAFNRFIEHGVSQLRASGVDVTADQFGAMCVGRWKNGTPTARSPENDDPRIAGDKYAPQNFFFWSDTKPVKWKNPRQPVDDLPAAKMDGDGTRCPLAGHVRKVNPRDEATDVGDFGRTLRRRMLRRGVTYGPKYEHGEEPGTDRGLLFLSYQRSISEQFEFVWRVWSNKTDTPRAAAGFDPIIGQNGDAPPDARKMLIPISHDQHATVTLPERVIISTGGAYLFAPSIDAIANELTSP